jgi:hypothetical protein
MPKIWYQSTKFDKKVEKNQKKFQK